MEQLILKDHSRDSEVGLHMLVEQLTAPAVSLRSKTEIFKIMPMNLKYKTKI